MAATTATPSRAILTDCIRAAVLAPSLHNSQPWRFRIGRGRIDVYADRRRRLGVLDPTARELMISIGAAIFTLRVALRRRGFVPVIDLYPRERETDLVARMTAARSAAPTPAAEALAEAISRRHTNRWPFAGREVPAESLDQLRDAARREGARLTVAGPSTTETILNLARDADHELRANPGYHTELARWATTRPEGCDGVPLWAMGPQDRLGRLPVPHFAEILPFPMPSERFEAHPTILVLSTAGDALSDHVRAGQALQRVLLTATLLGLAAAPISRPMEVAHTRERLVSAGPGAWPQIVLRVGYGRPVRATPRRPLEDVLLPTNGRLLSTLPRQGRSRRWATR
jgi:nitroreductase